MPGGSGASPNVALAPFCNARRLNDAFGVASTCQPALAAVLEILRWRRCHRSMRHDASTRTTKMSTLLTESVEKGASVSRTTSLLAPAFGELVPESEHAAGRVRTPASARAESTFRRMYFISASPSS